MPPLTTGRSHRSARRRTVPVRNGCSRACTRSSAARRRLSSMPSAACSGARRTTSATGTWRTPTRDSRARPSSPATKRRAPRTSSRRALSRSPIAETGSTSRRTSRRCNAALAGAPGAKVSDTAATAVLLDRPQAVSELGLRLCQELLELLRLVERPDERQAQAGAADHVLRDALHVLRRHGVEPGEQLLRLDRRALQDLAAQPEEDQPVRALRLQDEAALGERPRLLELLRGHDLVSELPELVGDHLHRLVGALQVDAGLREQRPGVGVRAVVREDVVGEAAPLAYLEEEP